MQNYTPKQAAEALGVHPITVYGWVKSGKIESDRITGGLKPRIEIPQSAIDLMRAQIEKSGRNTEGFRPSSGDESAYVERFKGMFSIVPPCFLAWKRGKITFTDMKNETERRMRSMME
jgi:excisionase family DNA binding protein